MASPARREQVWALVLAAVTGCGVPGAIGDAPAGSGGAPGATGAGGGLAGARSPGAAGGSGGTAPSAIPVKPPSPACAGAPAVGPAPLRRLTRPEYRATVKDLLGIALADEPRPPVTDGGFDNDISDLTVSSVVVEQMLADAETFAKAATVDVSKLVPCDPKAIDDACARRFIATFGQRAYRRPLEPAEVDSLYGTYALGKSAADARTGVEYVVEHVLLAPAFLYRVELGAAAAAGQPRRLTSWEVATRLSYLLWGTMPDQALMAAAGADGLRTRDQILAQARRMMRDASGAPLPAARASVASFHAQWLELGLLDTAVKNAAMFPGFPAMRAAMRQETERYTDELFWSQGTTAALLGNRWTFANAQLASLYRLGGVTGTDLRRVDVNPTQRAGLLTQASILSLTSGDTLVSPIKRGHFVRERILCTDVPPPPKDGVPPLPDPNATFKDDRQRYAAHSADPQCSACHRLMDPLGFAFYFYDAVGAYRTEFGKGAPIDGSGELIATSDADGPFSGAVGLIDRIAHSQDVVQCVSRYWFRYFAGRPDTDADACTIDAMARQAAASGGRMEDVVLALVQSDAFASLPAVAP